MNDLLKIENVSKRYLRRTALKNVSLDVEAGRTCLLLGPNGSGKTTLMKMIAGLVKSGRGTITLDNEPIGPVTKARIAYMPTENYFYAYMTVRDAGRYYKDFFDDFRMRKFERLLREMELDPTARIRHLSSGMSAKLRLALTLSRNADVMMFDEPLNGVDILTRHQVIEAITANRREGRTMLISTHLVDELEDFADDAVFMKHGKIVLAGPVDKITGGRSLKDVYIDIYGHASMPPEAASEGREA